MEFFIFSKRNIEEKGEIRCKSIPFYGMRMNDKSSESREKSFLGDVTRNRMDSCRVIKLNRRLGWNKEAI